MLLAGTAFVSGLTVVALVLIAAAITDRSAGDFTWDVRTLCLEAGVRLPFYAGWVSQLNIMVWSVAAALAGVVAYLQTDRRLWMLTFATLLTILALDDALTLHEGGPHRVIPEPVFYVAYAVLAVLLLALANDGIDDHAVLFLIGGLCLAVSIAVDTVVEHRYLVEDSFKLVGALLWLADTTARPRGAETPDAETGRNTEHVGGDEALRHAPPGISRVPGIALAGFAW